MVLLLMEGVLKPTAGPRGFKVILSKQQTKENGHVVCSYVHKSIQPVVKELAHLISGVQMWVALPDGSIVLLVSGEKSPCTVEAMSLVRGKNKNKTQTGILGGFKQEFSLL